jgi:prepilin-type N-terminal cleavage/methylation domain-containing protein
MRSSLTQRRGFTLIETMTVVVIVGVLATLAVYSVRRYINAAKSGEARQMILSIKAAEEAYREETYQYLATTDSLANTSSLYPHVCMSTTPGRMKVAWEQAATCDAAKAMRTLGVTATAPVMYGYAVDVAKANAMPTLPSTSTFSWGSAANVNGPAFAVVAMGDIDGNGTLSVFVSSSLTDEVYADNEDE